MGGKALKQYGVTRISAKAYRDRLERLHTLMDNLPEGIQCEYFVPGQVVKDDYGDMDILITTSNHRALIDHFKKTFNSKGSVKNGNCTSIEWSGFQVDFIHIAPEKFPFACHYYSHGTYAAILGKVLRYYHLKLGWDGLSFVIHVGNQKYERLLTRDWEEAMRIAGFDTFLRKESTLSKEELFEHLITTPLMQKHIFDTTRPDRNYGFQEEFFEWVVGQPKVGDRQFTRSHGWRIIAKYDSSIAVEMMSRKAKMHSREWVRPAKKFCRKTYYKYVAPVISKESGNERVQKQARRNRGSSNGEAQRSSGKRNHQATDSGRANQTGAAA